MTTRGMIRDDGGTISSLAISELGLEWLDCPCPTAKVCGGGHVISYGGAGKGSGGG